MLLTEIRKNKSLITFTFFNLFDKALVFLLPFVVLSLFKAKDEYVQLEYIISTVNIFATFSDFGMNGYMFYLYQKSSNKEVAVNGSRQISESVFIFLTIFSAILIVFNWFFTIHILFMYVVIRILFNYIITFFTSYFRLTDKPINAIYISLSVNAASLLMLLFFYVTGMAFSLWLVFIPQLVLIIFYGVRLISKTKYNTFSFKESIQTLKDSLKFSWPSIIQVFLMMFMANYGKVTSLDRLNNDEAVFLGSTLRFCMVMQLAHASLVGFYAKAILSGNDQYNISQRILKLYGFILLMSCLFVTLILIGYYLYFQSEQNVENKFLLIGLLSAYTLLWCFYSYLEMYYARINRNRIKLSLTLVILGIFVISLNFLQFGLLQNIAFAMFLSIFFGLIANIYTLKKLKFRLN